MITSLHDEMELETAFSHILKQRKPCTQKMLDASRQAPRRAMGSLLLLISLATLATAQCSFQISQGSPCGPEYVGFPVLTASFPSEAAFNQFLATLTPTAVASTFTTAFGCASPDVSILQYQLSFWCSRAAYEATQRGCSTSAATGTPAALCATQCANSAASIAAVINDAQGCPANEKLASARANLVNSFSTACNNFAGAGATCLPGNAADNGECGFLDPVTACAMAINSGNACCQSKFPSKQAVVDAPATTTNAAAAAAPAVAPTANINANTTTAGNTVKPASKQPDSKPNGPLIAGLIVGVLAALVACYAAYVLYRRRRTRQALFQQYMIEKRPYSTTFSPTGSALALEPTGNSRFGAKGGREDAVGSLRSGGAALMSGVPDSINRPEKAGAGTVGTGSAAVSPGAGKTRIVRVVHPYRAVLNDELTLVVGNDVIMTKEHNDGWADGIDPVTGARGVFPTTCVMDPDEAAAASIAKKEFRLSARHSSIYRKSTSNSPPGSKPSSQTKDNRQSLFSFASNASRKSINKHTYRVIHNYVAALDDELTLTAGNDIIVQQEFDDGWAKGMEPASGKIGLFPMTCVARADDVNAGTAVNKHSSVYTKRTSSISRRSTIMRPESTITPPAPPAKDAESVVVVHAYDVTDSDELALVVGRTILLIEAFDDGWAEGTDTLTGKTGVFPMACVARLSADTVESVPPARPENFAKRRSSIKSVARNETRLKIVHQYNATQLDELTLEVGKELVLIKEFNDGWARGKIVGSQKVGLFPLVCVQK